MNDADRPEFAKALKLAFETYRQPLPSKDVLDLWWQKLSPFAVGVVSRAFSAYIDEGSYAPVPADIVKRCRGGLSIDSRPGVEEAWALSVRAMDENNTVVMNNEIAEAMAAARPIFNLGDEVGARMAFKEIYARLVAEGREKGLPAVWWPSIGVDKEQRHTVLQKAVTAGLLPSDAAAVKEALPAPAGGLELLLAAPVKTTEARAALDGLKALLHRDPEAEEAARHERLLAEQQAVADRKAELLAQAEQIGLVDEGFAEIKPQ